MLGQNSISGNKDVILSSQGYERLMYVLKTERQNSLVGGIGGLVMGTVVIVVGIIILTISSVFSSYSYSSYTPLLGYYLILVFVAGIALLIEGVLDLLNYRRWGREIEFFTIRNR